MPLNWLQEVGEKWNSKTPPISKFPAPVPGVPFKIPDGKNHEFVILSLEPVEDKPQVRVRFAVTSHKNWKRSKTIWFGGDLSIAAKELQGLGLEIVDLKALLAEGGADAFQATLNTVVGNKVNGSVRTKEGKAFQDFYFNYVTGAATENELAALTAKNVQATAEDTSFEFPDESGWDALEKSEG